MKKIGRIKYTTMGQYDPEVTYTEMNTVLYEGSRWEAKKETTGNAPPDSSKNDDGTLAENEFWRLFLPGALGDDYVKKTDLSRPPTETEAGNPGVNFPDGKTIQIDENGMLTGTPLDFMGTWKSLQEGIASGEIKDGMIGYIRGDSENEEDSDHPNSFLFPVDDFLSLISSNAVQNRIVTAALERLEQLENETRALRASLEQFGLAKICPLDLTDVTEDSGMVLSAVEKNASIEGTLASDIQKKQIKTTVIHVGSNVVNALDMFGGKYYIDVAVNYSGIQGTIISSHLVGIQGDAGLSNSISLMGILSSGTKISTVRVAVSHQLTVRCYICVLYY